MCRPRHTRHVILRHSPAQSHAHNRRAPTGAETPTVDVAAGAVPNPTTIAVTSTAAIGVCYSVDGVTTPACSDDGASCTGGASYLAGATVTIAPAITTATTVMAQGCQDVGGGGTAHSLVATFEYMIDGQSRVASCANADRAATMRGAVMPRAATAPVRMPAAAVTTTPVSAGSCHAVGKVRPSCGSLVVRWCQLLTMTESEHISRMDPNHACVPYAAARPQMR